MESDLSDEDKILKHPVMDNLNNILRRLCGGKGLEFIGLKRGTLTPLIFTRLQIRGKERMLLLIFRRKWECCQQQDIGKAFYDFYRSIFGHKVEHRVQLNWQSLYPQEEWEADKLEQPFNESEVRDVIFFMAGDIRPLGHVAFLLYSFKNFGICSKGRLWKCFLSYMMATWKG